MKTCHLILTYENYYLIDTGKKTVEYRNNTPYWRKRILDADRVTFHQGYTNVTTTFSIRRFKILAGKIEIHLGTQLSSFWERKQNDVCS